MMRKYNPEALRSRADALGEPGASLNGIKLVFVSLEAAPTPSFAWLDVEFFNTVGLADIDNDIQSNVLKAHEVFELSGGSRIPAGKGAGKVRVREASYTAGSTSMRLKVKPIGDYSSYTLRITYRAAPDQIMDPIFAQIEFKFRPGCFNINCAPQWQKSHPPPTEPVIDYLTKDFDSFKHQLINALRERVPGWSPTSEADLDQVLIDLIAADADELSDFQDRVMNEAYLGRARKRVSLARHARLMDYHIHQGNQADTWLALEVDADITVSPEFCAWTGENWHSSNAVIFKAVEKQKCRIVLNRLQLYRWDNLVTALEAGATEADLALPTSLDAATDRSDADMLRDLLRSTTFNYLLLEEKLNPETGNIRGRDPGARQLLRLLDGKLAADSYFDPDQEQWYLRVRWRNEDRLQRRYCFFSQCDDGDVPDISVFHANLVRISHGRPHRTVFRPPETILAAPNNNALRKTDEAHFEPTPWGTICRLPNAPIAYRNTPPGGEEKVTSSLEVKIDSVDWSERSDLILSESGEQHFMLETDERGISCIRFGNNRNGLAPAVDADIRCDYQVGAGAKGNIGADSLTGFDATVSGVVRVWNPFDVTNGRDPEPAEVIIRRVPEAYRSRQQRAVVLQDYRKRAEQLPGVAHAQARYAWTGSWRTVRVAIDPKGTTTLTETQRKAIASHLDALRLIGEDLEIRLARYVSLDITLRLCAKPAFWPEDLQAELEMEFSDAYTADGRPGFFNPDQWTFGQPLYASQLIGRAIAVTGVDRVLTVSIRRLDAGFGPATATITISPEDLADEVRDKLEVTPYEIVQVANDPSHLEHGRIQFDIRGGRQ